ncbi:hypothetical protein ACIOJE_39685 [Kitasatospora sp. NPDC087861]|uniref:hypothetical protein n=1 Tax=Kitasatospora sp. NPDC087861 TaxID=3364070 RepID=UPI0037F7D736
MFGLGTVFVAYSVALLTMVVLLERWGVGRVWRLAHGGGGTVLRVLPVLLAGVVLDALMRSAQMPTTVSCGSGSCPSCCGCRRAPRSPER